MPTQGMRFGGVRLRWLLVLIVAIAAAPSFALNLARLSASSETALAAAHERAATLARDGAQAHVEILAKSRQLLELLRQVPAVRHVTTECNATLRSVDDNRPWITSIFVVDRAGRGICGSMENPLAFDISKREYFQAALNQRSVSVSDVIIGQVSKRPVMVATLPMFDERENLDIVVGVGIDLAWINRIATEASAKFGGLMVAVDRAGRVVLQQPQRDGPQEQPLHDGALVHRIVSAAAPTFEGTDAIGDERIFGVARLAETGTTIAVGLKRSDVLEPSDRAFRADLLFLLFVTIGSAAAALLVAEFSVLRGVRLLKSAALHLKAGRMGLRVTLPPFVATELHDFAATYNAMTAEFERLAYLDRLTGLPNRRYLERQLRERGVKRGREAVLAIDLDGFKPVNDTHGHAVGDRVLAAVARRINDAVTDRGLLARVGGDEFAAIVPLRNDTQTREIACGCAEGIRKALEQPIEIDGVSFPVGCSIGVAIIPDDASTLAGALAVADAALYEAKRAGRNRVIDHAPPLAVDAFRGDTQVRQWAQLEMVGPW
jgi:diguanylate cyclase (GGDEF)-like protein